MSRQPDASTSVERAGARTVSGLAGGRAPGLRGIAHRLARIGRQPRFVIAWLVPVWIAIGLASLAIAWVPMRRLHRLFGRSLGAVAFVPLASAAQHRRTVAIGRTVRLAAAGAPFRADCFPTAIVAQLLCRLYRVPAALHLGVRLSAETHEPPLAAHAWVVSGSVGLTGGRGNLAQYTPLGCWVVGTGSPDDR